MWELTRQKTLFCWDGNSSTKVKDWRHKLQRAFLGKLPPAVRPSHPQLSPCHSFLRLMGADFERMGLLGRFENKTGEGYAYLRPVLYNN